MGGDSHKQKGIWRTSLPKKGSEVKFHASVNYVMASGRFPFLQIHFQISADLRLCVCSSSRSHILDKKEHQTA
jgi:hypothetical protein